MSFSLFDQARHDPPFSFSMPRRFINYFWVSVIGNHTMYTNLLIWLSLFFYVKLKALECQQREKEREKGKNKNKSILNRIVQSRATERELICLCRDEIDRIATGERLQYCCYIAIWRDGSRRRSVSLWLRKSTPFVVYIAANGLHACVIFSWLHYPIGRSRATEVKESEGSHSVVVSNTISKVGYNVALSVILRPTRQGGGSN